MSARAARNIGDHTMQQSATAQRQNAAAPQTRNDVVSSTGGGAVGKGAPTDAPQDEPRSFEVEFQKHGSQFEAALPPNVSLKYFQRCVMTAIATNPDLKMADKRSLFLAALQAAQDGLVPDGKEGAFVIYNAKVKENGKADRWIKKVQWMPMVGGILKRIRNSGELSSIVARVVYVGDKFRNWIDDAGEHLEYEAADEQDRSTVRRVFAMAKLKDGSIEVEVLSPADVEKIRAASKSPNSGPWVQWWDQMAQKSAIRRLSKRLPLSSALDDMIRRDDALYELNKSREEAALSGEGRASINSRLDKLSDMPALAGKRPDQQSAAIAHHEEGEVVSVIEGDIGEESSDQVDPETGEILEGEGDGVDQGDADQGDDTRNAGAVLTPRERVIAWCRTELQKPKARWVRVHSMLGAEEQKMLTDADKENLKQFAAFLAQPDQTTATVDA